MRLPSLILLASVALALTVQAQERNIVDVVLQVNGEIQSPDGQQPNPEVAAPLRQGPARKLQRVGLTIAKAAASKQPERDIVQADPAGLAIPEVTAPRLPSPVLQADAISPACPEVTAPRHVSKKVAAKAIFNAAVAPVGGVEDEGEADGPSMSKGKGYIKEKGVGNGGTEQGEEPTRTTVPELERCAAIPQVTAPRAPARGREAHVHFAGPADPEVTAPRTPGRGITKKVRGITKKVKVKILRRGDVDVVVDGAGPNVKAPVPQVTSPVIEAEVAALSRPDSQITKVKVRVNGIVVAEGDEARGIAQDATPGPGVTAPLPAKPAITSPANPVEHIAEAKKVSADSSVEKGVQEPSASDVEKKKPAGMVKGFVGRVLGTDINLGGKRQSQKIPADNEKDWDHLRLFGDDGYVSRPLPVQPDGEPGCEVLPFRDQMVWDQQGDRGRLVDVPDSKDEKAPEDGTPKADIKVKPEDDGRVASSSSSSTDTDEVKDDKNIADTKDDKEIADTKDDKGVTDPSGVHVCLVSPCDDSSGDEDTRIDHKQRTFLRQFKGKALRIDSRTGCPVSSDKLTQ